MTRSSPAVAGLFIDQRLAAVLLEVPYEARIEQGVNDYILLLFDEYRMELVDEEPGRAALREHILSALDRVQRRWAGSATVYSVRSLKKRSKPGSPRGTWLGCGAHRPDAFRLLRPDVRLPAGQEARSDHLSRRSGHLADWLNQRMARTWRPASLRHGRPRRRRCLFIPTSDRQISICFKRIDIVRRFC